jgi:hypothetical protein
VSLRHVPVDRVTRTIHPDLIVAHAVRAFDVIVIDRRPVET